MTPRTSRTLALGFAGLGLVGALAGCSTATSTTPTDSTVDSSSSASDGSGGSAAASSGSFKDGTYTEDGSYLSPAGQQSVTVKVTLADNKITAVTVTPHATDPTAKGYQNMFVQGIAAQVVGKDIDQLNVSRVAGSSLTSGGFNKAITAIEKDASA
jgi:uncharacterized protein with FMN-binding domain